MNLDYSNNIMSTAQQGFKPGAWDDTLSTMIHKGSETLKPQPAHMMSTPSAQHAAHLSAKGTEASMCKSQHTHRFRGSLKQLESCPVVQLSAIASEVHVAQPKLTTWVASISCCLEQLPSCLIALVHTHAIGEHVTQMSYSVCISAVSCLPA